MIYNLRIRAAGFGEGIKITAAEYSALVNATKRIYLATGFEEKLDLLLENYLEYERELLNLALESCLFWETDDHRVFREAQTINRRIANLLTAARLYIDQMKHSVSSYFAPGLAPNVAAFFTAEYEQHVEYRIAEALRNHAQHRELPVHQMSWPFEWEEIDTPQRRMRVWVVPSILVDELATAGKFKASILAELQRLGEESLPLTPILRQYVESMCVVHDKIRQSVSSQAELDYATTAAALDRARVEFGQELAGLVVSAGENSEAPAEHHYISDRSWTRREVLLKKNSRLTKLSRKYVSAEHPSDTA